MPNLWQNESQKCFFRDRYHYRLLILSGILSGWGGLNSLSWKTWRLSMYSCTSILSHPSCFIPLARHECFWWHQTGYVRKGFVNTTEYHFHTLIFWVFGKPDSLFLGKVEVEVLGIANMTSFENHRIFMPHYCRCCLDDTKRMHFTETTQNALTSSAPLIRHSSDFKDFSSIQTVVIVFRDVDWTKNLISFRRFSYFIAGKNWA